MENTYANNIHENQIYPILSAISNIHGLFINPILEASSARIGLVKHRRKIEHATVFYSPFPTYFFFSQWFILPFVILWACVPILYYCVKKKVNVIHARNLMSGICAVIASKIFKVSVIVDMRGVHPDEGVLIGRWRCNGFSYRIHKFLEAWVYRSASSVVCISPNLCEYVKATAPSARPIFVPAMVNPQRVFYSEKLREKARTQLKISKDDLCLIYIGSLGAWHNLSELKKQIASVSNQAVNKKTVVIILSNGNPDVILSKLNLDMSFIVRSVPPSEVNYYLNAADIGLVPAKEIENESDRIVFDVMISSKAEEYLCSGLDVCANPIIPFFRDSENFRRSFKAREEVAHFYQSKFSNDTIIAEIKELYRNYG